ncbi:unnamed protein product [Effrenium voratum]|nr:unnamed protein product [Effrenium voratum]
MTGNVREAREGVYEIVTMKTFVDVVQIVPPQKGLTRSYSWPRLAGAATEVLKVRGLSTLKQDSGGPSGLSFGVIRAGFLMLPLSGGNQRDATKVPDLETCRYTPIYSDIPTLEAKSQILQPGFQQEVMQEKLAAKHRAGECLPCIFFTRKGDGCRQGDNCTRCHICTATEARRRRNRISLEMKKSKKAERRLAAFN